jgi:bifunctional non-homologous end joining protein LigD
VSNFPRWTLTTSERRIETRIDCQRSRGKRLGFFIFNQQQKEVSMEQITLYYRQGSSDKIYRAEILPCDGGYAVQFAYGRRGTTLQTGTKTQQPVSYDEAKNIFEKLVASKTSNGYAPGESGTPYQDTKKENRATGILPQLLNPITEAHARRLLRNPEWCIQEKYDGRRMLVRKSGDQIDGINRNGLVVALPQPIATAVAARPGNFLIDGEAIGDSLIVFDLLEIDGIDYQPQPYELRLARLVRLLHGSNHSLALVRTAFDLADKSELFERLQLDGKEGAVFKALRAPYAAGRPASGGDALKLKFYETASFIVSSLNTQRSVSVGLWSGKRFVPAGNVTIPPNKSIPRLGAIVELRYLYAFAESGCVYQPVYLAERTDVDPLACTVEQLKYKAIVVENAA